MSTTPFSQIAHIIGAKRNGPRGRWNSKDMQDDPSNLMMLCADCHKEIDYGRNEERYPVKLLREMKKEHEEKVKLLLDTPRSKTTVLTFKCAIKDRPINIPTESVINAVLPDYPDSPADSWHTIDENSFSYSPSNWERMKELIDEMKQSLSRKNKFNTINKLSVFGVGPMPLLMYLGYKISDTYPASIYHARRDTAPKDMFLWQTDSGWHVNYKIGVIQKGGSKRVLLLLSLSDYLDRDKYVGLLGKDDSVYQLTIDNPSPLYLKRKIEIDLFKISFRELLNKIQKECGKDCEIDLLPAVPASIAIEVGRSILPTKDPKINVYEYFNGNPKIVLSLD